jgi:membrane protease YdiL (CAAX protease family)
MDRETKIFFVLAYLITWIIVAPLALQGVGLVDGVPQWLHFAGAFGPLLAGLAVTASGGGAGAVRRWMGRILRLPAGRGWILFALFGPVLLFLLAVTLLRLFGLEDAGLNQFGRMGAFPDLGWAAGWLLWLATFGLGEEVGWRGFALPRLQARYSARTASLILGLIWAGWHLPLFFYSYDASPFSVLAFTVSILSGAAFLTWLFNSSAGSVLVTVLWHGTYNATVAGAEGAVPAVVTGAIIIAVILIANRYGPETLSSRPKQTYERLRASAVLSTPSP